MAFGLMKNKWGILDKPIATKVKKVKHLIVAIAKLHNFCINERLLRTNGTLLQPQHAHLLPYEQSLCDTAAQFLYETLQSEFDVPYSHNRKRMTDEVAAQGLERPKLHTNM